MDFVRIYLEGTQGHPLDLGSGGLEQHWGVGSFVSWNELGTLTPVLPGPNEST